jgi:hypothetical protein
VAEHVDERRGYLPLKMQAMVMTKQERKRRVVSALLTAKERLDVEDMYGDYEGMEQRKICVLETLVGEILEILEAE